jgi:hypothetical protein
MNNINTGIDLSQEVARTYVIEKDATELHFTSCTVETTWPQQQWKSSSRFVAKSLYEPTLKISSYSSN